MVINLNTSENADGRFASAMNSSDAEIIYGAFNKYCNDVLFIFCVPKNSNRIYDQLIENAKDTTFITISEKTVFDDDAKSYLTMLAKESKVKPVQSLYENIKPNTGYNTNDLNGIFSRWYNTYLKTEVYPQYHQFKPTEYKISKQKPKGSAYNELCDMIGLSKAKEVMKQALDFYKAQKLFSKEGLNQSRPAMHMVFTGNPGTAKTSVARLFARIMKENNLLTNGDLIEVGRADLVGQYVGSTAPKVKNCFRRAKGGVLFIDEAYSLVDDRDGLYGDEAINTIVQEMENARNETIVIFAGYPNKMEQFLNKNPGLRSRIAFHIPFDDYNAEELYSITELIAKCSNLTLDSDVRNKLIPIFEDALMQDDFGNGRFVRNLMEKARMKQASRLVKMDIENVTKKDLKMLKAEDFEPPLLVKQNRQKIGFC